MGPCQVCLLRCGNLRNVLSSSVRPVHHVCQRLMASASTPEADLPVIRVPRAMQQKVQDLQQRKKPLRWRGRIFTARPGKEIITSKRKEFTHYLNQSYDKFSPPKLASQGWKHSKARGDYFTIVAYKGNPSLAGKGQDEGEDVESFQSLKLDSTILDGLKVMGIDTPTSIQVFALPVIKQGRNSLCAAETGSGKTLAYLLPLMHRLLVESRLTGASVTTGLPRGVVLVPVAELAAQVWHEAQVLGKSAGLTVQFLDAGKSLKIMRNRLSSPTDIVISTPGPILSALRQEILGLRHVSHVVVDEADTMLDDSFVEQTLRILKKVNVGAGNPRKVTPPGEAQLTLVGATMPSDATNILSEIVSQENLTIVSTPYLHQIMPHVQQKFLRLHSEDKAVKILELLKKEKNTVPTMIFCNTSLTCNWLAHFLKENGVETLRLHSRMGDKSRSGVMSAFKSGKVDILVCTDIGSRGVDTVKVQHVINFDFPNFMSDYIHRAGRVGRVGSQGVGHVTNFVVHKWDVDLVNKIERAVRTREGLPRFTTNIKRAHFNRAMQEEMQALQGNIGG
ncbi:probable ATP-dependent RNA helicase DDX28 [Diadema antillarum]|uniref:probable ATP-dependent RNA helicase DDX28 n=1 Tax=Diadema antillarum TaxID=105358 RepID=UPI003A88EE46